LKQLDDRAVDVVMTKLFSNYRKWCVHLFHLAVHTFGLAFYTIYLFIFQRLLVSKTGVSTKSLICSGLLVNALLKLSSQHAHIMICQRSSANGRSRQG